MTPSGQPSSYELTQPFNPGMAPGPQSMFGADGWTGMLLRFGLQALGGTDSSGEPFLRIPGWGVDGRTVTERMLYQGNYAMSRSVTLAMQQSQAANLSRVLGQNYNPSNTLATGFYGTGVSMLQQMMDPSKGMLQQGLLQGAGTVLAGITGDPYGNLQRNQSIMSHLGVALDRAAWSKDDFTRRIDVTYGLTEEELAPLTTRMAARGAFGTPEQFDELARLDRRRTELLRYIENAKGSRRGPSGINQSREELAQVDKDIDRLHQDVDAKVEKAMRSMSKTISSMKMLYGSASEAAEALYNMYGDAAFGLDDKARRMATEKANQTLAFANTYGINPQLIGRMEQAGTMQVASGFGFSQDQMSLGWGMGTASRLAENAKWSTENYAEDYFQRTGRRLGQQELIKIQAGYNQRNASQARSNNRRVEIMLQHAAENGMITNEELASYRHRLATADKVTQRNILREFGENAFGSYDEFATAFYDDNFINLADDRLSQEGKDAVSKSMTRNQGIQDANAVATARLDRQERQARRNLLMTGMDGKDIRNLANAGAIKEMERHIAYMNADMLQAGQEFKKQLQDEGADEATINQELANFYRDAASSYLSGDEADRVFKAGREGAISAMEGKANPEAVDLGKRIDSALRGRQFTRQEKDELYRLRQLLREGKVDEAKSGFEAFVSKTGKRGDLLKNKKFGSGPQGDFGTRDAAAAATAHGENVEVANVMDKGTASAPSQATVEGGKAQEEKTDEQAKKVKDDNLPTTVLQSILGPDVANLLNGNASSADFEKSPLGAFLKALIEGLRGLMREKEVNDDAKKAVTENT